jgi:ABC-2 type transport system permease protein
MSIPSNAVVSQATAPVPRTRPMYWSVRRELWENRSIYIAPLVAAGVFLFGFLISTITLPRRMAAALAFDPLRQEHAVMGPYNFIAGMLAMTGIVVGVFYCLDALHGERRDRSILFWKSLPVSDRTTVLAKTSVPFVVLPLFVWALSLAMQLIMLTWSTVVLLSNPPAVSMLWRQAEIFQSSLALLYGLVAITLWLAPIYGWLLLVSAWARRATFLWAVLPPAALAIFEWIAFRTSYIGLLLAHRVTGWFKQAFDLQPQGGQSHPLMHLTPLKFLTTPGLWIGLAFAVGFLAAAIRLRRYREPI